MNLKVTLAVLLLVAATAHAEDRQKARELFRLGSQHYNLGEYKEALAAFKDAYRNYEDPLLLFNVAQCERQLDMKSEAVATYRAYLRAAPDAPNRDEVKQLISQLQAAVDQERTVRQQPPLHVESPPPAAATPEPTTPSATTAPVETVQTRAPAPERKPVYKKGWFWATLGAVVVVGAGVGLAVGLTRGPSYPSATTPDGTIHF